MKNPWPIKRNHEELDWADFKLTVPVRFQYRKLFRGLNVVPLGLRHEWTTVNNMGHWSPALVIVW